MSQPLSESSSSSGSSTAGFIFLSKSVCIDNVKSGGSLVSLGSIASHLDLGGMSEEELVDRIQSMSIENDELRAVLQHNNGLLENHFKDLTNMQGSQRQRSEHLTRAHEKAKDVVKKLRGRNRGLEKDLRQAYDKIAELEMQLALKDASTEESRDQTETKQDDNEPLKDMIIRLNEEKKALAFQNQILQEHINKVRTISESEEIVASAASSDVWSGNSDLISSEFGSATEKSDSADSKFDTDLEIVKVDLAQVRVEYEQKELLLTQLMTEKESWETQRHQLETEMKEKSIQLQATKEQADEWCRQLEAEKSQLEVKCQKLQAEREQVVEQQLPEKKAICHESSDSTEIGTLEMVEEQQDGAEAGLEQVIADLTKQLTEGRQKCQDLQNELDITKAEKIMYKEQVDSFDVRYKEAEENAKAFDLGDGEKMKQKFDAQKEQLWKYQQREGVMKDKEEALLVKEAQLSGLLETNNTLYNTVDNLQLQLEESRQRETALQDEINVRQQEIEALKNELEENVKKQTDLQAAVQGFKEQAEALKQQLEENSRVHAQVDGCRTQIETLQQQLKEEGAETESKLELATQRHEEEKEALKQLLQEALDDKDRAEHLRAQVCQLIQENHSLEAKVQDLSKENSTREEFYSQRMYMLEQDYHSQHQQKDAVIDSLRQQFTTTEDDLRKVKTQQELGRKSYDELLAQHEQVMVEYNDMVHNFQATLKAEKKRKESASADLTNLHVQVDHLTAQLFTAEEAIQKKEDECNEAKERLKELESQLEGIPIMRTQLELYQSDFQAERDAREREHAEVIRLKEENHRLLLDIQRTEDELDRHNDAQLNTMQQRHRSPPPQVNPSYQGGDPNPGWFGGFFVRRGAGDEAGSVPADIAGGEAHDVERRGEQPANGEENHWSCPQCQRRFPDFDSLQIHAVECNGRQEQRPVAPWCPKCGNYYPDMDTLEIHIMECLDE